MPSFSQKIASLVDTYNHAKTSPAYRELNMKYKTLKATNQELMHLLTNMTSVLSKTVESGVAVNKLKRRIRRGKSNSRKSNAKEEREVSEYTDDEDECVDVVETVNKRAEPVDVDDVSINHANEMIIKEEPVESVVDVIEQVEEPVESVVNVIEQVEEPVESVVDVIEQVEEDAVDDANTEEVEYVEEEGEEEEVEVEEDTKTEEVEMEEEGVEEEVEVEEEGVEEEVEMEEEEEQGVYEIEINGTRYYTTDEQNGTVYAVLDDDEVGDEVGVFVNGKFQAN